MNRLRLAAALSVFAFATGWLVPSQAQEASAPAVLTPGQAVQLALQHSPTLAASTAQRRQAYWALSSESAKFDPTLLLDAGVTRTQNPSLAVEGNTSVPRMDSAQVGAEYRRHSSLGTDVSVRVAGTWQETQMSSMPGQSSNLTLGPGYGLSAKLGVTQPLLRGAGQEVNRTAIVAAQRDMTAAKHGEQLAASSLARDTLNAYAELWYASRAISVQKSALELASRQRDDAISREKTGSLAQADVLSFDTTVATREESVIEAEQDQTTRRLELIRLMGGTQNADFALLDTLGIPSSEQGDLVAEALAHSSQLQQLQAALASAAIRARTADDPQRSRLDLDAYLQVQGLGNAALAPAYSQLTGMEAWSAHVGLTYELPVSGKREAEARKAQASVEVARQNLEAARAQIRADVQSLIRKDAAARARLTLAERTVVLARQTAQAQQQRFQTGAATALQVIEADNQVRSAELRLLRASVDAYEAIIALRHATGRLVSYVAQQ